MALVDLGLMLLLLALAARLRAGWGDLYITPDWPFFFQFTNELEQGLRSGARAGFPLYTSIPFLLFSLLNLLLDDPVHAVKAWAIVGALAAPVSYLAARGPGGRAAGLAVGVLVAISAGDCRNLTGLETPGPISLFTACAALGLVAGAARRPWGPPLMIFGTAMAIGHHTGLWLMAPLACGLAVLHGLSLSRRDRIVAGAASLVVGGLIVAAVFRLDGARLAIELPEVDSIAGTWGHRTLGQEEHHDLSEASAGLLGTSFDLLFASDYPLGEHARFGLNVTPPAALLILVTWLVGCGAFALRAARYLGRPRAAKGRLGVVRLLAAAGDVQLIAMIGVGMVPYLWMASRHLYLLPSHVVAFLPLVAVATVGSARASARLFRPSLRRVLPAVVACAWVGLVEFAPDRGGWTPADAEHPWIGALPLEQSSRSFRSAAVLSEAIRGDARGRGQRPFVYGWFDRTEPHELGAFTALVQEMANASWRTHGLQPACYLVVIDEDAGRIDAGRPVPTQPETPLTVVAFETCAELSSLEPRLCGEEPRAVVHLKGNWPVSADQLLGCATHGLW